MASPQTHKALTVVEVGKPLEVRTVPTPIPISGSAVVKLLSANIGPQREGMYLGGTVRHLSFPTPLVPGETAVCRVVSVAPDAVAVKPGDLVLVDPLVTARDDPSGTQILLGLFDGLTSASKKLFAETWRDGLWSEMCHVPLENCIPLNEEILMGKYGYTPSNLAYLSRMAVAYGGCTGVDLRPGHTVIIAPATGQFTGAAVEVASALGANVIAVGRSAEKLERLRALVPRVEIAVTTGDVDADTAAIKKALGTNVADGYIDLSPPHVSNPAYMTAAIRCLRANGRVALMGMPQDARIECAVVMLKSLTIKGQYMYTREEIRHLVRMAEAGIIKLGSAAGHELGGEFKLEEWGAALATSAKHGGFGEQVMFTP
jgi:D-arabinose 1-dehydrogenase-like Zn-dependent alcohol dehydrogenase